MKPLIVISFLFSTGCYGQSFKKLQTLSSTYLFNLKDSFPIEYYNAFQTLLTKRDTAYLKHQINSTKANLIYLIEGYNFKTDRYSLFEEYKHPQSNPPNNYYCSFSIFLLDKKVVKNMQGSYFLFDTVHLRNDNFSIDTIFPRKYRYGGGCVITDSTSKIFADLEEKAKKDGIVIEEYCKIETLIDKTSNKIFIKYYFPISGQREFESRGIGMLTDYPQGLDFWLFVSPYIVDK